MNSEIITILLSITGSVSAFITARAIRPKKDPTYEEARQREKEALISLFKLTQDMALQVREQITDYVAEHELYTEEICTGITYEQYLRSLYKKHRQYFSSKALASLRNSNFSLATLQSYYDELEEQYQALSELKMQYIF